MWRTVGGKRIFIKDGQDLATAMKESGKFLNKYERMSIEQLEEAKYNIEVNIVDSETTKEKQKYREELNKIEDALYDKLEKKWDEDLKKGNEKEELGNIVEKMKEADFEKKVLSKIKTEDEEKEEIRNQIKDTVHARAQKQSDEIYKKMTEDERESLNNYTMDGYYDINEYLKGNYPEYPYGIEITSNIDNAISRYKMETDYILYRGVHKDALKGLAVGDNYNPQEYLSTSLDKKIGMRYAENQGSNGALIKINASKEKTEGIFIGVNSASYYDEAEFLMKHDSNMKITKIYTNESGIIVYEMEVIGKK